MNTVGLVWGICFSGDRHNEAPGRSCSLPSQALLIIKGCWPKKNQRFQSPCLDYRIPPASTKPRFHCYGKEIKNCPYLPRCSMCHLPCPSHVHGLGHFSGKLQSLIFVCGQQQQKKKKNKILPSVRFSFCPWIQRHTSLLHLRLEHNVKRRLSAKRGKNPSDTTVFFKILSILSVSF